MKKRLKLGIIGQRNGKCCRGWCLDCEVIRGKTFKQIAKEIKNEKRP